MISEKGLVFFPDPFLVGTPADVNLDYEDVWLTTADGVRLHGWWVPQPGCPTLLWFHGNGGNISHRLENLALLWRLSQVQVFIFDYREYGRSEGEITRAGTYLDAAAAYQWVTAEKAVPPSDLILFGRSLGSALALDLAVKHPARALILESAFTSSHLTIPVLIIHGQDDEIIPAAMGRRLYEAAPEPKELYIIPRAHHNDTYLTGGDAYFSRLRRLIHHS